MSIINDKKKIIIENKIKQIFNYFSFVIRSHYFINKHLFICKLVSVYVYHVTNNYYFHFIKFIHNMSF